MARAVARKGSVMTTAEEIPRRSKLMTSCTLHEPQSPIAGRAAIAWPASIATCSMDGWLGWVVHAQLVATGAIGDNKRRGAAGADRRVVQVEVGGAHDRQRRPHHGKAGRQPAMRALAATLSAVTSRLVPAR